MTACPLCRSTATAEIHRQPERPFLRCGVCRLVFVPKAFHLARSAERAVYEQHQNSPDDPGYRAFLTRLFTPLRAHLAASASGLDFGCGPGPTLSGMFRASGIACEDYDPFFRDDPALLARKYDFITCTEVLEHLTDPAATLAQLVALLGTKGWLGVMTKRVTSESAFAKWHYIRDPTHVAFFSDETFVWIGERYHLAVHFESKDVVLLAT